MHGSGWGLAAAAAILLVAGTFLLFETTTTGSGIAFGGCSPQRRGWSSAQPMPPPDATYTRIVHDGETIEVTHPAGRYEMLIETQGATLDRFPYPPPATTSTSAPCAAEPYTEAMYARGDGTMTVSYWLLE